MLSKCRFSRQILKGDFMKIVLNNSKEIDIQGYEKEEDKVNLKGANIEFADVFTTFSEDNTSLIKVVNDFGDTVCTIKNYILGDDITYNQLTKAIDFSLKSKEVSEKVSDLQKNVTTLTEQLTQAQADIAYIGVLSDIDAMEDEAE